MFINLLLDLYVDALNITPAMKLQTANYTLKLVFRKFMN